jgi:hypothetical protein
MEMRRRALIGVTALVGVACGRPADEPDLAARTATLEQAPTAARVGSDKPLIHVWKSPT